jgi:hypothetical protein
MFSEPSPRWLPFRKTLVASFTMAAVPSAPVKWIALPTAQHRFGALECRFIAADEIGELRALRLQTRADHGASSRQKRTRAAGDGSRSFGHQKTIFTEPFDPFIEPPAAPVPAAIDVPVTYEPPPPPPSPNAPAVIEPPFPPLQPPPPPPAAR